MSPQHSMNNSTESMEILRGTSFALEDRVEPIMLDETEEEQMHDKSSNVYPINLHWLNHDMDHDSVAGTSRTRNDSAPSLDIFHGMGFSLGGRMEPMVLDEAEGEEMNGMPSNHSLGADVLGQTHGSEFGSVASSSRYNNSPLASLATIPREIDKPLEHCREPFTAVEHSPRPPMVEVYKRKEKTGYTDDIAQQKVADVFNILSEADVPVAVDNERPVRAKKMKFREMVTPGRIIRTFYIYFC